MSLYTGKLRYNERLKKYLEKFVIQKTLYIELCLTKPKGIGSTTTIRHTEAVVTSRLVASNLVASKFTCDTNKIFSGFFRGDLHRVRYIYSQQLTKRQTGFKTYALQELDFSATEVCLDPHWVCL